MHSFLMFVVNAQKIEITVESNAHLIFKMRIQIFPKSFWRKFWIVLNSWWFWKYYVQSQIQKKSLYMTVDISEYQKKLNQ